MPEFLVFRLYGPLASWGEIAVGERRGSYDRPSKSAVLGLVAAGLGIRRDEEEQHGALDRGYGFAVRGDAPGVPLRDFHTAQAPSARKGKAWATRRAELAEADLNTVISYRDHYADAVFTVALWARDGCPHPLAALADALNRPVFPLYLGRRACPPALPLAARVVEAESFAAATDAATVPDGIDLSPLFRRQSDPPPLYWEADPGMKSPRAARVVGRRDGIASRRRWQFAERAEQVGRGEAGASDSGGA